MKLLVRYELLGGGGESRRSKIVELDSIYSKQAHSLIGHCRNLVRLYEQAAAENMGMAKSHREIAAEIK